MPRWLSRHLLLINALLLLPLTAVASWVSVHNLDGGKDICLESKGRTFHYRALSEGDEVRSSLSGPRRLKIISRYLFADDDEARVPYTVVILLDGNEVLRKRFTGKTLNSYERCGKDGRVSSLRRSYVELPSGRHQLTMRIEAEGRGRVALRLYRQVKRTRSSWMTITPDVYESKRHLEFESGNRSGYYHLTADQPLALTVNGPTSLRVRTRLDFEHTMNGSQQYTLDVLVDGQPWQTFHFDSTRYTSAVWLENPDLVPGNRQELVVPVPRGPHRIEIRCVRPEACGVATMLHIPERDLER